MDDYSQEQWYQVFDEEYETHYSGHTDEPLGYDEADSEHHRRAALWNHSWATGNPRSEAIVTQAQELIAAFWRLVEEKDVRLQRGVPGVFRCGIPGRRCNQRSGWIGQACWGCGQEIPEHIFTAVELDDWFAEVNVLVERGLNATAMARYLCDSSAVWVFDNYWETYELARQCFDGLGDGPAGLAVILTTAVESLTPD